VKNAVSLIGWQIPANKKEMTMTQKDQINEIAERAKITKAEATRALLAIRESIVKELMDTGRYHFAGLGTFTARNRKPRLTTIMLGPKKGQKVAVPARKGILFRAAPGFKAAVNP
jgi:DNA-binding protein HU-beta